MWTELVRRARNQIGENWAAPRNFRWIWGLLLVGHFLLVGARFFKTGTVVAGDGVHYYSALRSLVVDGNLDLDDEFAHFLAFRSRSGRQVILPEDLPVKSEATGRLVLIYPVGLALFLMPPFAVSHGTALLLSKLGFSVDVSGYGVSYQLATAAGSLAYGFLAVLLAYACGRRYFSAKTAFLGATTLWLATPLVYYMAIDPLLSHAVSAFSVCLFLWKWIGMRGRERPSDWLVLGVLGGWMSMVRYQDGVFLLLPGLDFLAGIWAERKIGPTATVRKILAGSLYPAGFAVVFSVQLWINHRQTGMMGPGYSEYGGFTNLLSPKMFFTLFAEQSGLLRWSPVAGLSLAGLWMFSKSERRLGPLFILGFLVQWYLVSSWCMPWQGESFGSRMLLNCTGIFTLGYMQFLKFLEDRKAAPTNLPILISGAFIGLNAVLAALYCLGVVGSHS